ncbi:helix-turn-helix domain-containing protein [Streptomyces sp. NPDC096012]|uniref:PucR family transcriptional regulator n=1 Tax=Streptomyces sp. NPDC096012 TaxID=3155684 RepID=UPI00336AA1FF
MADSPKRRMSRCLPDQAGARHAGGAPDHRQQLRCRPGPAPARTAADPSGLLALSRTLFGTEDEKEILRLSMSHLDGLGPYRAEGGYLMVGDRLTRASPEATDGSGAYLDLQVRELDGAEGAVALTGRVWSEVFGLRLFGTLLGALAVSSASVPTEDDQSLLMTLVGFTSTALSLASAQRHRHADIDELKRLRSEQDTTYRELRALSSELDHQRRVCGVFDEVAASGGGEDGITHALYELTGLPVLVEDRFGNLRSWAGPGRPDPYPAPAPTRQGDMLRQVALAGEPVRIKERVIALARPRGEVLGVLALVDPDGRAEERDVFALEHAVQSLTLELMHLRRLAEVELRLRRQLVDDLLEGTDEASAYARSEAVGHDLHRPHHVIVVHWPGRPADDFFARALLRAAATLGMRPLVTRRGDRMVLLTEEQPHGEALHAALVRELGTSGGAIGVSTRCPTPRSIPRCYEEAQRALEVRRHSRQQHGTTFYDDLGLFRLLGPGQDREELEGYVREWLGPLLEYDAVHGTDMVQTLALYFDCGGNYDETAGALAVHRSTLRYRLQRIREISDRDLGDVDTRLNLQVATRVWGILLDGRSPL